MSDVLDVCTHCGLARTRAITADETRQDYVIKSADELERRRLYFQRLRRRFFRDHRGRRLLDIGCAEGSFVSVLRAHGWTAFGLDAYERIEAGDEPILRGTLDTFTSDRPFDVLTLVHSFEHMPQPRAALAKCHALLAESGRLLIIVPHYGGILSTLAGEQWWMLKPKHHYFHYSEKPLTILLEQAGFDVTAVETYSGYVPSPIQMRLFESEFFERGVGSVQPFRSLLFRSLTLLRPVMNWWVDYRKQGAELVIIAAKRGPRRIGAPHSSTDFG